MEQLQIPYFPNSEEFSNYTDPRDFKYQDRHVYYKFLEILPTAGTKEIQRAILAAFKKYHPDSGRHAPKEFENLIEVKEILTNPHLKKIYDRTGFTKEQLVNAIAQLTGAIIECTKQGANSFENAKEVIIEYHRSRIENHKNNRTALNSTIDSLRAMIKDIQSSAMADLLIANLEQEIKVTQAKITVELEQIELNVSLCWLISSMYGKTPIPAQVFSGLTSTATSSGTATNGGMSYTIQY